MQMRHLASWLGTAGLLAALASCVVHDTAPVNPGYGGAYGGGGTMGYGPPGSAPAGTSVGEPTPYYVASTPPEPLYEQMTPSPGDGYVWIDGYWHWNGYEWVWVSGRWERDQSGYVYVEPSYDYVGEQFVYTPGYWSQPTRVPRGWMMRDHRDGRPTIVAPPAASAGFRPGANLGEVSAQRPPIGRPGPVSPPPIGNQPPQRAGTVYHPAGLAPTVSGGHPTGATPVIQGGAAGPPAGTVYRPPIYRPPVNGRPPASGQSAPIWVNPARPAPATGVPGSGQAPSHLPPTWSSPPAGGGMSRPPAPSAPTQAPGPGRPGASMPAQAPVRPLPPAQPSHGTTRQR